MDSYFKIRRWEICGRKTIYDYFGVRFFKRYLLLTDILMYRIKGRKRIQPKEDNLKSKLETLIWETKRDEIIHLVFIVGIIFISIKASTFTFLDGAFLFVVNLYINIYPIFVQRFNRHRLQVLLTRQLRTDI